MPATQNNQSPKKVLVCPLNWGLGHATRDVEIIQSLLDAGFEVIIGADKAPLSFLKEHFHQLNYVVIPSVTIKYPRKGSLVLKMLVSAPKLLFGIIHEHRLLKQIIKKQQIDIVISDNRFGLWNKTIYSIFITHQIWIKSPRKLHWTEPIINSINHWFINKYNECWIPDFKNANNLSGELSHGLNLPKNSGYIGILSRLKNLVGNENLSSDSSLTDNIFFVGNQQEKEKQNRFLLNQNYEILVILSGPEPQRSILENILTKELLEKPFKTLILQGKPGEITQWTNQNIDFINHLNTPQLKNLLLTNPVIICRSGYSGIMDLVTLNKKAILIPTPGQTEQQYLADYLNQKKWFYSVQQHKFELEKSLTEIENYEINCKFEENSLLKEHVIKLKKLSV